MTELSQGANTPIAESNVKVVLSWPGAAGVLDGSAYLLTASGKVRADEDMVFYNQPRGADGAVAVFGHDQSQIAFSLDLLKMPPAIERVVFCLTVDGGQGNKTMASFSGSTVAVTKADGSPIASYRPDLSRATEAAMMLAELYLRNGQWKVRAVGQGFNGGLGPLARSFGIDIAEPTPSAPTAPPAPAPAAQINLSKITLDKAKPTVNLEKRGESFGELSINLNWSSAAQKRGGLFGGGRSTAIDLDLGCLYELQDGYKGIVQALGNTFGDLEFEPYIALSGDDRTGAVSAGETIRVNGKKWSQIKRIALFCYIYDGAPNWQATDGVVTIT
ncbi:TerD family protein, partial [Brevundimonas sp.]